MIIKVQNQLKCAVVEEGLEKQRKMVGPTSNCIRTPQQSFSGGRRQSFAASAPPSAPGSNAGSDVSNGLDFTKEDVEALLNERMRTKNKYNYKERCEQMMDYIRRLRLCIRWFQEVEGGYLLEQESLRELLESGQEKCHEMEVMMQNKEEELNSIIMELRKNYNLLQEKCANEELAKMGLMDDLSREKEARIATEKLQASLSNELERAHQEQQVTSQKISSLNDMYKRLQEYNTSLQQYNSKLQTELADANETLKRVEREKASIVEEMSTLKGQHSSLQEQFTSFKAFQEETAKQKEVLVAEVGSLRTELRQARDERDRQLSQVLILTEDVAKYKDYTGRSASELDCLTVKSTELEATCSSQDELVRTLQVQLAAAQRKLQLSDRSAIEMREQSKEQNILICDLQNNLIDAEQKLLEGEKLRKKLHNTILELKGNIRVFCRVRPLLPVEEVSNGDSKVFTYPTSTEAMGRGVDLLQSGQKHSFTFDKVFMPDASQDNVFVEISQLVQSALDGYKVCIFAYGQTGSGKTFTMMGNPENPENKGLIPRSLEQIFETRQTLQSQGWKYELQVSMLEIYNETIRDLLSTNRSSSTENGTSGKQFMIKHDAQGNTNVSDLTIVDVCSTKEVSYLLEKAAQSRSVGKTLMNEQSSRSHFVFTLRISGVNESTEQQVQGVLNLIDLAGSERLSKSGCTGDRLKETQAINKSLSSLSDVIFALAKREDHVPFRNSKLTYLLQPCLGGDSKTLMFVNISPEPSSLGESLCSLRFAARVNACEIGVPRRQTNVRSSESRVSNG